MAKFTNINGVAKALNQKYGWNIKADRKLGFLLNVVWDIQRGKGQGYHNYNLDQVIAKLSNGKVYADARNYLHAIGDNDLNWNINPKKPKEPHWEDEMPEANMDYVRAKLDRKLETEGKKIYVTESQIARLHKRLTEGR